MIIKAFEKRDLWASPWQSVEHGIFQGPLYGFQTARRGRRSV